VTGGGPIGHQEIADDRPEIDPIGPYNANSGSITTVEPSVTMIEPVWRSPWISASVRSGI